MFQYILIIKSIKAAFKTKVSIHNSHLNLFGIPRILKRYCVVQKQVLLNVVIKDFLFKKYFFIIFLKNKSLFQLIQAFTIFTIILFTIFILCLLSISLQLQKKTGNLKNFIISFYKGNGHKATFQTCKENDGFLFCFELF